MYLDDFVKKYDGKKVDFDGVFGPQCVDLFRQYCKECLGIKEHTGRCGTTGGAKDLYIDYPKMPLEEKYFYRCSDGNYIAGDIAVWDSSASNKYGHVAIVIGKLNDNLIVFEQDGFKLNGAKISLRSMKNLLGVLRKR